MLAIASRLLALSISPILFPVCLPPKSIHTYLLPACIHSFRFHEVRQIGTKCNDGHGDCARLLRNVPHPDAEVVGSQFSVLVDSLGVCSRNGREKVMGKSWRLKQARGVD
ncbi:hypothetical protein B0T13DRAFT_466452 [Neurospora crassa]|nr:hypothetical protein B0T13DRAFT_466452 [Neurospora crassa]